MGGVVPVRLLSISVSVASAISQLLCATVQLVTADSYLRIHQSEAPLRNTETWSTIIWLYRTEEVPGEFTLIDQPGVFALTGNDANQMLTATFFDAAGEDHIALPIEFDGDQPNPMDEWCLIALSLDPVTRTATAIAQTESSNRTTTSVTGTTWTGGLATGEFTLGKTTTLPAAPGLINCFAFAGHALDEVDFDDIWRDGEPQICRPLNTHNVDAGGHLTATFLGVDGATAGCSFVLSFGSNTSPNHNVTGLIQQSNPDDPIRTQSLIAFNARVPLAFNYDLYNIMTQAHPPLAAVSAGGDACRVVNVHDLTKPWSGFFDIQITNSLDGRTPYVIQPAPLTRALVHFEPAVRTFLLIGANSRSTRIVAYPGVDDVENYIGGATRHFESILIGVNNIPLGLNTNKYRFFRENPNSQFYIEGDVKPVNDSPDPDQAFARWWSGASGGSTNGTGAGLLLNSDDALLCLKAKPEPGTRLNSAMQPMQFNAYILQFPGGGEVTWQAMHGTSMTTLGSPIAGASGMFSTDALDTITHTMAEGDSYADAPSPMLLLAGDHTATFGSRNAVYISSGAGAGALGTIESISYNGTHTILALQHELPVAPSSAGASVLKLGTAGVIVFQHQFAGERSIGPYRGIAFTAPQGSIAPVMIHAAGAFATDLPGVVLGPFGRAGFGWSTQVKNQSVVGRHNMLTALDPDVFFQFYAEQANQETCMRDFGEVFREACPDAEHWWVGDPQYTSALGDYFHWDQYILDEAPEFGIGSVTAIDDKQIGNIWDQCAQGFRAAGNHHTDDGAQKYVERVCQLLKIAALPFHADYDGDGAISASDRDMLCAAMGSSRGDPQYDLQFDLDDDGVVDSLDLGMFDGAFPPSCAADLVSAATFQPPPDGFVDAADLAYLLGKWTSPPSCADLVSSDTFLPPPDGAVDAADLAVLLGAWGPCN